MAPNSVSYDAIQRPVEMVARKPTSEVSLKLAVTVAACAVVLFFAGRNGNNPSDFSHADVMDIASFCSEGQYIGGCTECKECATYEFANGGCSYFKDTFCTYCQPINDCPREQVVCTTQYDSKCGLCDCDDPIVSWTDIEVRDYMDQMEGRRVSNVVSKTFSCYIADDGADNEAGSCKACKVCPVGFFEVSPCDPANNEDTVCARCTQCDEHEFTARTCTYATDTVCRECDYCADEDGENADGVWTKSACERGSALVAGSDAVCEECSYCDDGSYVTDFCNVGFRVNGDNGLGSDTECAACTTCEREDLDINWIPPEDWTYHIAGEAGRCKKGERFQGDGCTEDSKVNGECVNRDTIFEDCPDFYGETACKDLNGFFESGCDKFLASTCSCESVNPPVILDCKPCAEHEFTVRPCSGKRAAICKPCAEIGLQTQYEEAEYMINEEGSEWELWRKDPYSGELAFGMLPHCDIQNHRCASRGEWFEAVMGVHKMMVDQADACSATGEDESHCEFTDEQQAATKMVLSYCATKDEEGKRCGDEDDEECDMDACEPGFVGRQCQYAKQMSGCGTDYNLERTARKGRKWFDDTPFHVDVNFPGKDTRQPFAWIAWCMNECESSPFCHAFEVDDNGTGPEASGHFLVNANSQCRLFTSEGMDFCPIADTGSVGFSQQEATPEPNWAKDCYVNTLREDASYLERIDACPGSNPAPAPAFSPCMLADSKVYDEEACTQFDESEKAIVDHGCDSLTTGLTWCEAVGECVDQTTFMCVPADDLLDQCPGDEVFCYCSGMCQDPEARDADGELIGCSDPITGGMTFNLGTNQFDSCWAVQPYMTMIDTTLVAAALSAR